MNLASINISAILPAVVLSVFGIAVMVAEPFVTDRKKSKLGWLAFSGTLAGMLALVPMADNGGQWYSNLWIVDDYNIFFNFIFLLIAAVTILTSLDFLRRENMNHAEFYALLLFATAGMLMMSGSNELMMIFLGLEILSIATYVMAGFRRTDLKSNESALKYFLLGSFSSAFFLYGVALIFGATGSTNLLAIKESIRSADIPMSLVYLSAALMLIALCFKVAVAPFHIWTPDVYEGAPTPVTGFMSVGPKAAGFAVLFRVFLTAFPMIEDRWVSALWLVAALTMVLGNVIALVQPNIKRMLAYSSIAHAGYVAVALTSASNRGGSAALFYLLAYSLMNLGAFAVVTILSRSEDKKVQLTDYAGLGAKRPGLAAVLSLFLLSLAGVPGTAGFAGKFFIFRAAVESHLVWLAIIGVVTTVISFYYYLYVIVQMYMREPNEEFSDVRVAGSLKVALVVSAIGTLYLGILPTRVLDWTTTAALNGLK
ncbi:MAG: NADH-quinone oxidoreductase subunit N [Acidobacteria bacterium]|nr:MAG: NADH-quinone oxidoreductase subunit N [Acidobacteriota bacterium]